MNKKIYLDYNATTPLHPAVKQAMMDHFDHFANPSSMHSMGREVNLIIEQNRASIAKLINADASEIIFTGGGSESNNTILKMVVCNDRVCQLCRQGRDEIITTTIEHPSIMQTAKYLQSQGIKMHFLKVDSKGKVDLQQLEKLVNEKTALVSVMYANNEIGTIQDIETITKIAKKQGALVHTDAVQALGKIPVDVKKLNIDYFSFSGHKIYGPKGIGGLYLKKRDPYCPLIHGGHQESGRRAGTLNNLGIIGMGVAADHLSTEIEKEQIRIKNLRDRLKAGIEGNIDHVHINGHETDILPNTLNVSFKAAEGESILLYLDLEGINVSTGSACASGSLEPSHVLLETGVGPELAHASIRFSLGRETTEEEIDYVIEKLPPIIQRIRKMSTIAIGE